MGPLRSARLEVGLLAYRRMLPDVELLLEYPYTRTTGPVLGQFLTGLRDGHLLGIRHGDQVLCPPLEYDPATGKDLDPVLVDVATEGIVMAWTWVAEPTSTHPFDHPFAFALVLLDGTEHAMAHAVDTGSIDDMSTGMRVAVQFHEERSGSVTDFHFVPVDRGELTPIVEGSEPVTDIVQLISLHYREPLYAHRARFAQGLLDGRFIGQRSPASGKVYVPGRGYDPLERIEMGEDDELTVADRGTVTSFTVITPVDYYGQKETKPYIRASILLDGSDSPLISVDIRNLVEEDMRVGLRLQAVWRPTGERDLAGIDNRSVALEGVIERWDPTGEPDADAHKLQEFTQ
jgi:uncharacterized OB-fold protein